MRALLVTCPSGSLWRRSDVHPVDANLSPLAIDFARGLAEQGGDEAAVLVIGSVYLAGEIREILEKLQEELGF